MSGASVRIYDTTLRDGAQAEDVAFTVEDKIRLLRAFDEFGIHYVEGGWPGSNPRDELFFKRAQKIRLKQTRLCAFGSTHHPKGKAKTDANLKALVKSGAKTATIFGKSWDLHVREALGITLPKNLAIIENSVSYLKDHHLEVIYDAEHFFDGFKKNPEYAADTIRAAQRAGADWIIFCDTNGGTLPHEVESILREIIPGLRCPFGIHCHNDSGVGVANSLTAVRLGATQVQGTINGFGERCGNADLVPIIADLQLKMNCAVVASGKLKQLRQLSRLVQEVANLPADRRQPFVGRSAFAHKGGIHVSALTRNRKSYEHIRPEQVGNDQRILVSDLSGKKNLALKAQAWGLRDFTNSPELQRQVLSELKNLEQDGFQFEAAEASLELMMRRAIRPEKLFFTLHGFRVLDELSQKEGEESAHAELSEATITVSVDGKSEHAAAFGNGPVDALNQALRKALDRFFPELRSVQLVDYKVRVLPGELGTASKVRVLIESTDGKRRWGTVGVSHNIILASWQALVDSLQFPLLKTKRAKTTWKKR